ncbi:uncharacterized protein KY384_005991 [Bacidia gigantensis]|uniref:uncharacterized protein n=1 Tax=Bacidia gigantensis TaxID=2732470 RepID=UPI001D050421|nr:uncharacterized protein KY384_005991 [Bacidia gigantensis]KAG8529355.1 hypothetical protein KY384_005991 [Bacidia gigantensis]
MVDDSSEKAHYDDAASTGSSSSTSRPSTRGSTERTPTPSDIEKSPDIIFPTPAIEPTTTRSSTRSQHPDFEVDWAENDPGNPINWSSRYKATATALVAWSTLVVVVYSTSYTSGLYGMMKDFQIDSEPVVTLGITTYLVGLAIGSMFLAPLSEMYGRKPIYVIAMSLFTLLIIPCGLATSLPEVIVVRFIGSLAGASMIANSPGTVSDISTEKNRALFFSIWSIGPLNGPTFGPIIGGFATQYLGWRFTNWIVMMMAGTSVLAMILLSETYPPVLLQRKAANLRKDTGDERYWCRYDNRKQSFLQVLGVNLKRPFVMLFTEPICIFWDLYVSVIYGILYLCYVAYPIVFTEIRGWSLSFTGLSFTGIGIGCFITILCEPLIRRMIESHRKDLSTGKVPPEAMVSVICIAAVLCPVGEIWFAWTCLPPVHWSLPIVAGIPFGAGNTAVFIYAVNYLAHSYGIYAASALAGNSLIRSLCGGGLPLAGAKMYSTLNAHWAGTLLGLLQVSLIPIPVIFYKYGHKIRMKSALIQEMQRERERLEQKRVSRMEKADRERKEVETAMIKVESNRF